MPSSLALAFSRPQFLCASEKRPNERGTASRRSKPCLLASVQQVTVKAKEHSTDAPIKLKSKPTIDGQQHVATAGVATLAPIFSAVFLNPLEYMTFRVGQEVSALAKLVGVGIMAKVVLNDRTDLFTAGLAVHMLAKGLSGTLKVLTFNPIMNAVYKDQEGPPPLHVKAPVGAITSFLTSAVVRPLVYARAQAYKQKITTVPQQLRTLVTTPPSTMFAGWTWPASLNFISTPASLLSFTYFRGILLQHQVVPDGPLLDLFAGGASCAFLSSVFGPINVVRNQLVAMNHTGKITLQVIGQALGRAKMHGVVNGVCLDFIVRGPEYVISYIVVEFIRRSCQDTFNHYARRRRLAEAFRMFDADHSGELDRDELHRAFEQAMPMGLVCQWSNSKTHSISPSEYRAAINREVDILLKKADTDGNGRLSLKEFQQVGEELELIIKRSEQKRVFDKLDVNNDGTVSLEELKNAVRECAPLELQKRDLSTEQYNMLVNLEAKKMMKKADRNGDGSISFEEFALMMDHEDDNQKGRAMSLWLRAAGIGASR